MLFTRDNVYYQSAIRARDKDVNGRLVECNATKGKFDYLFVVER